MHELSKQKPDTFVQTNVSTVSACICTNSAKYLGESNKALEGIAII